MGDGNISVARAMPQSAEGSLASPQVLKVISLNNPALHPRQLAYDKKRDGLWFWTSTQALGTRYSNHICYFDIRQRMLHSWPIDSHDWSSQLFAGLAVAPNGDVWIGWNTNLLDFHPSTGSFVLYSLPTHPRYPLSSSVMGDLPANLGVADIAVAVNGVVWIARYGALSLTTFSPSSRTFQEYRLPSDSGDPAKLAIGPNSHIFFTTNLDADRPGHGADTIGEFDPTTQSTVIYQQGAQALTVTPNGTLYTASTGHGFGLSELSSSEQAIAASQHRPPQFQQRIAPLDVDDSAIASDIHGRIWVAVAGRPDIAVFTPSSGETRLYQYAAPSVAAFPSDGHMPGAMASTMEPGAVWIVAIVAMTTDSQGHLWYIRAGSDTLEEVDG